MTSKMTPTLNEIMDILIEKGNDDGYILRTMVLMKNPFVQKLVLEYLKTNTFNQEAFIDYIYFVRNKKNYDKLKESWMKN